jgi:flagellin-like hook-associated protein FlgL
LALQRALGRASDGVATSLSRLSSGQRINRPSDDAASLAVATGLNLNNRVFTQGIRNINDGQSLLGIADAALGSLSTITSRLQELASQSANGSLGLSQRLSLQSENDSLVDEFNRLIRSTTFNGLNLLDGTLSALRIQAGFGVDGGVGFGLTQDLSRSAGTATFSSMFVGATVFISSRMLEGDINGDGKLDIVSTLSGNIQTLIGNGDGTFISLATDASGAGTAFGVALADVNGDGSPDLLYTSASSISVQLNNGSGTFGAATALGMSAGTYTSIAVSDFNGDGIADIAATNATTGTVGVRLGSGNGGFATATDFVGGTSNASIAIGDLNGDGVPDIVTTRSTGGIHALLGNGDGTFRAPVTTLTGSGGGQVAVGDFNFDGKADLAVLTSTSVVSTFQGDGSGSFGTKTDYSVGAGASSFRLTDFNSDGVSDLVVGYGTGASKSLLLGATNGSFTSGPTLTGAPGNAGYTVGDFNGDGTIDLVAAFSGTQGVFFSNRAQRLSTLGKLNITTAATARSTLTSLDAIAQRIALERGTIGASQSRLLSSFNSLTGARDESVAASARITDVDVASETASLLRSQILQKAGVALLAQANKSSLNLVELLQRRETALPARS